ncbi:MAG: hypothetical protein QW812_05740 [Thermoplasmataceae archaeon]
MQGMKLENYIGADVRVWLLGQAQLSLTPGMSFEGKLLGVDQGVYIIESKNSRVEEGRDEILLIPVIQCRISLKVSVRTG